MYTWLTVNVYRPFTADVDGILKGLGEIETAGKLRFTALISNSHLIEQTTRTEVLHGLDLTRRVSKRTGLPIAFVAVVNDVLTELDTRSVPFPVLAIDRSLLKPWERSTSGEVD